MNSSRCARLLLLLVATLMPLTAAAGEYRDMGNANDFDKKQNIYFDKESSFGGTGWPQYWAGRPMVEDSQCIYWATTPDPAPGQTTARIICYDHFGRFRVVADKLPTDGPLYLSIRYKDDLIPNPDKHGAPVFAWDGKHWRQVGTLGGKYDHRWKTTQFTVSSDQRAVVDGHYVFKIGIDRYKHAIEGELPVDKIMLAADDATTHLGPDTQGLWPKSPPSKFEHLNQTREFIPGQGPFFPFGVYISGGEVSDGGSATHAGHGANDFWQILENAHMNCYAILGWEQNWYSHWKPYANLMKWARPGHFTEMGLKEHLIQARAHHLKIMPGYLTDTRAYWIRRKPYGNELKLLDRLRKVEEHYANDPNILAFYPVDEWDHEDHTYGKPKGFIHLLYDELIRAVPNRPRMMLSMGFQGATTWKLMAKDSEMLAVDAYLNDYGGTESGLKVQANRLDTMRNAVPSGRLLIMVADCFDRKPQDETAIVSELYLGITHGAGGVMYFCFHHPKDPKTPPGVWKGLNRVGVELFGKQGIAKAILPPSVREDLMGENGVVKVSPSKQMHFALWRYKGTRYLIMLNASSKTVKPTVQIKGLAAGTPLTLHFDGRKVTAAQGAFTDTFEPFARHVYTFPAP